jgi:hypothetical protein
MLNLVGSSQTSRPSVHSVDVDHNPARVLTAIYNMRGTSTKIVVASVYERLI